MEVFATFHIPSKEGMVIVVKFERPHNESCHPMALEQAAREKLKDFFQDVEISYRFKYKEEKKEEKKE